MLVTENYEFEHEFYRNKVKFKNTGKPCYNLVTNSLFVVYHLFYIELCI